MTNNLDTGVPGDGSLRGEIAAAQSGDTIDFASSMAGQTITLTSGEFQALGGDALDGGNGLGGGVFNDATSSLTLQRSAIVHNEAIGGAAGLGGSDGRGVGGGIYNLGTLLCDAATVIRHNHTSTSSDDCFGC